MIVVKMMGGLGNQMFQYAYARALQEHYGDEEIYLDLSGYETYKIRNFGLNNLAISSNVKILNKKLNKNIEVAQKIYRIYQFFKRRIDKKGKIGSRTFELLAKKGLYFNFDLYYYPIVNTKCSNKFIYGYFQSEKYFSNIKDLIREELKVKIDITSEEKELLDKIKSNNSVAISIRWGDDYRNNKNLNICTKEYFYNAIDIIKTQVINPTFFIFTDEVEKVKKDFIFEDEVNFIEKMEDYQSLRLMYNCNHFIISNSSFSWFGAYLGTTEKKIIISPNYWTNNSKDKSAIFNEDMIRLGMDVM